MDDKPPIISPSPARPLPVEYDTFKTPYIIWDVGPVLHYRHYLG